MSGINPLIDTLMHQVLGRQGEVSLQRALSEPVKAIPPGEGPRALAGDSSLDGRSAPGTLNDLRRLPEMPGGERLLTRGEAPGAPPGSTQTHFSPAARTIADVLLRFPAPAPVIRPAAPLLAAHDSSTAVVVAERLEASVRDSGLFYEAHLKRWFQGDMSRQQLLREPQMQPGPRPVISAPAMLLQPNAPLPPGMPVTEAGASAEPSSGRLILPGSTLVYVSNGISAVFSGMPNTASVASAQASNVVPSQEPPSAAPRDATTYMAEADSLRARSHREIVHESLQGLVRQQLDMLVTPTIRWEGDVWAGIFMALVIQLPNHDKAQENQRQSHDPEDGWRSEMRLEVPNVGAFSISLWFYRAVLSIDLTATDSATHQYLETGISALEQRLNALDLEKVQVRARYVPQERDDDLAG